MSVFDPTAGHPRVPHGGTFNANPVTMAAGLAALRRWDRQEVERLNHLGSELRRRSDQVLVEAEFPAQFSGDGSLFKLVPGREPLLNYRSVPADSASQERLAELQLRLLGSGIIVSSKGTGCLSTPMGRSEVDTFVDTLERAIREMRTS
jgi:glutamate-1-semialdehyde 2,1-aminomutase